MIGGASRLQSALAPKYNKNSIFFKYNRPSNYLQILATTKRPIATQQQRQTVHNDGIRNFLFIQLKYDTIYCNVMKGMQQ